MVPTLQIHLDTVYRSNYSRKKPVIHDIQFHASHGNIIDILGISGSGKTTLLLALNIQVPFQGDIRYNGSGHDSFSLSEWRATVSYLPSKLQPASQSLYSYLLYPFSFRIHRHKKVPSREQLLTGLEEIGCPISLEQNIQEISLGQQYRVSLLRILLLQPSVYLLDEPFANLDPDNVLRVQKLLEREASQGKIIIRGMHTSSAYPASKSFLFHNGTIKKWEHENGLR